MTGEDMKRRIESIDRKESKIGQTITIPIIIDSTLPHDGWYLKPSRDFVEAGHE